MDMIGFGMVSIMGGWVVGLGYMMYMHDKNLKEEETVEEFDNLDGIQIFDWRERA